MDPIACETCQRLFTPRQKGRPNRFCSRPCYGESLKGPQRMGVAHRTKTAKGHPLAPPSGVVAVARLVLFDQIGPGEHPCNWCGVTLKWATGRTLDGIVADHLNHDPTNDNPDNIVASCNSCNAHRRRNGDAPRIQEGELTVLRNGRPTRAVKRYCNYCEAEFLTVPAEVRNGKGLYCSRSHARSGPRGS